MKSAEAVPTPIDPNDPILSEIEQVREKREALKRARFAREAAEAPDRKLAEEKLALENEEAIELAEQNHGARKIAVVQTDLGVVIVKRAHPAVFKRFQDHGKTNSKQLEELVRPCLVHPTLTAFERICDELPATMLRVADAVSTLAGIRSEDLSAKS